MPLKYALFAGSTYYPSGGWNDWRGSFSTIEEALIAGMDSVVHFGSGFDWWHIVDQEAGEIIRESKPQERHGRKKDAP